MFVDTTSNTVLAKYFEKRRTFAYVVLSLGMSFGTLLFAMIYIFFNNYYGVNGNAMILIIIKLILFANETDAILESITAPLK